MISDLSALITDIFTTHWLSELSRNRPKHLKVIESKLGLLWLKEP